MDGATAFNFFPSEDCAEMGTRGRSLAGSAFPGGAWERDEGVGRDE